MWQLFWRENRKGGKFEHCGTSFRLLLLCCGVLSAQLKHVKWNEKTVCYNFFFFVTVSFRSQWHLFANIFSASCNCLWIFGVELKKKVRNCFLQESDDKEYKKVNTGGTGEESRTFLCNHYYLKKLKHFIIFEWKLYIVFESKSLILNTM